MIREVPPTEIQIDESLCLKRLRLESAGTIYHSISENREHLRSWLPFVDDTKKLSDTEIFLKSVLNSTCPKKDLIYEIWYERAFAGLIALKEIDAWNKKTELGYWITSRFEGKGLITKSCRELIDLSFNQLGLNRIQLKAAVGNARSCMVAERLNFRVEGIERQGERHHNKYFDLITYGLLKRDWVKKG